MRGDLPTARHFEQEKANHGCCPERLAHGEAGGQGQRADRVQGDRKAAGPGVERCKDNQGSEGGVKGLTEGDAAAAGGGGGLGRGDPPASACRAGAPGCRPSRGRGCAPCVSTPRPADAPPRAPQPARLPHSRAGLAPGGLCGRELFRLPGTFPPRTRRGWLLAFRSQRTCLRLPGGSCVGMFQTRSVCTAAS